MVVRPLDVMREMKHDFVPDRVDREVVREVVLGALVEPSFPGFSTWPRIFVSSWSSSARTTGTRTLRLPADRRLRLLGGS